MRCEVPLANGGVAFVDDVDYDAVSQYVWRATTHKNTTYAQRSWSERNKTRNQYLHHFIMPIIHRKEVDHRNRNGLDCSRENLRYATRSQNMANQKTHNERVGYKGVWPTRSNTFSSMITLNYRQYSVGTFPTAVGAALAYDREARRIFGEYARPNFIERPMLCSICGGTGWSVRLKPPKASVCCSDCHGRGVVSWRGI